MSDEISKREKNFEKSFENKEELKFKAQSRAVKKLGAWAANEMSMDDAASKNYVEALIDTSLGTNGIVGAEKKVLADLKEKNIDVTEHHIHNQYQTFFDKAHQELMAG